MKMSCVSDPAQQQAVSSLGTFSLLTYDNIKLNPEYFEAIMTCGMP